MCVGRRLPDGVGTNGFVAEVPRFPLMNFHGKVWAARGKQKDGEVGSPAEEHEQHLSKTLTLQVTEPPGGACPDTVARPMAVRLQPSE